MVQLVNTEDISSLNTTLVLTHFGCVLVRTISQTL